MLLNWSEYHFYHITWSATLNRKQDVHVYFISKFFQMPKINTVMINSQRWLTHWLYLFLFLLWSFCQEFKYQIFILQGSGWKLYHVSDPPKELAKIKNTEPHLHSVADTIILGWGLKDVGVLRTLRKCWCHFLKSHYYGVFHENRSLVINHSRIFLFPNFIFKKLFEKIMLVAW